MAKTCCKVDGFWNHICTGWREDHKHDFTGCDFFVEQEGSMCDYLRFPVENRSYYPDGFAPVCSCEQAKALADNERDNETGNLSEQEIQDLKEILEEMDGIPGRPDSEKSPADILADKLAAIIDNHS